MRQLKQQIEAVGAQSTGDPAALIVALERVRALDIDDEALSNAASALLSHSATQSSAVAALKEALEHKDDAGLDQAMHGHSR